MDFETGLQLNGIPVAGTMSVAGSFITGILGQALFFDGATQWVDLGDYTAECFGNPSFCPYGATHAFWLRVDASIAASNSRVYVISSGAQAGYYGWALYWDFGSLWIYWTSSTATWGPLPIAVTAETWYHFTVVWHSTSGLVVYLNGYFYGQTSSMQASISSSSNQHYIIGGASTTLPAIMLGTFTMDDYYFWNTVRDDTTVLNFFLSYNWRE